MEITELYWKFSSLKLWLFFAICLTFHAGLALSWKFTAPHYIGSSAWLSSSPWVTQSLHAWRSLACFTIICTGELELILAVVTATAPGERMMLWVLLNQEETTQELQYGQLFTRKGLSCVNWQWGPVRARVPGAAEGRGEKDPKSARSVGVRSSRSVEQRTQPSGPGRQWEAPPTLTASHCRPPARPDGPARPNWFWKVLEDLKCWCSDWMVCWAGHHYNVHLAVSSSQFY